MNQDSLSPTDSEIEAGESRLFHITEQDRNEFKRLDQFLAKHIEGYSRTFIKNLFEKDQIQALDGKKIELKKMPSVGTMVEVMIPPPMPAEAIVENIPLEILYEDEHLLFVNKPAGLVTHPAPGNYTGTLVNAILYHCKDLKGVGDQKRPGIVHRLDKGTSGVMVVAKTQACHEGLVLLFSSHNIERIYHAIVMGHPPHMSGTLTSTIGRDPHHRQKMAVNVSGGKKAITHYKVLENFERCSLIQFQLETGRTHQIRVHTSSLLKRPILCDPLYGSPADHVTKLGSDYKSLLATYPHPFLHARVLGLKHPITGEQLRFEVEPPKIFQEVLQLLRK